MKKIKQAFVIIFLCAFLFIEANAQLSFSGQLRTRTELRDGQGAPLPKDAKAAFFTSQRTRLSLGYKMYRLKFGLSLQDVRVWGQDVSTINRTTSQDNNGLLFHEAWAEIGLSDTANKNKSLALKIGRQELMYDDQRLLGNLDWAQQGRRHDAVILKFGQKNFALHAGLAFNQNKENASGALYNSNSLGYASNTNGGTAYKSFQYLHLSHQLKYGAISVLLFADQFSRYSMETVNGSTSKVWTKGVWSRKTTGLHFNDTISKISVNASAYYQSGKNGSGQEMDATLFAFSGQYNSGRKSSVGAGFNYTTGGSSAGRSNAFDPLYGTPHKFWGGMDYFYAATSFGNKGLADYYLKAKYKVSKTFHLSAEAHEYFSASNIFINNIKSKRRFGTGLDIVGNYSFTKTIGFEAGYSHFFSTVSLASPSVKNIINAQTNNNWAYMMINIRPDFFLK